MFATLALFKEFGVSKQVVTARIGYLIHLIPVRDRHLSALGKSPLKFPFKILGT
jgi:hypothetical protein